MPYLIKGANVFTPKFLGKKDVLILEEKKLLLLKTTCLRLVFQIWKSLRRKD